MCECRVQAIGDTVCECACRLTCPGWGSGMTRPGRRWYCWQGGGTMLAQTRLLLWAIAVQQESRTKTTSSTSWRSSIWSHMWVRWPHNAPLDTTLGLGLPDSWLASSSICYNTVPCDDTSTGPVALCLSVCLEGMSIVKCVLFHDHLSHRNNYIYILTILASTLLLVLTLVPNILSSVHASIQLR